VADRELETYLALLLADQNPALAAAHDELYPERVPERIPLSITLLYPFAARSEVDRHRETLRSFFASHPPFDLELAGLAQWEESARSTRSPSPSRRCGI
jgi:2'-5' RNA ligase